MNGLPDVTVVIPTRNRAGFLRTAVAGALKQQGVSLEVVVVNDGSTDETAGVLKTFDDSRLRVIDRAEPGGVANARNAGIEAARGTWVAFCDDDDVWAPWKLRHQLAAATPSRADFVYARVAVLDEERRPVGVFPMPNPDDLLVGLLRRNVLAAGSSNVVARRSELLRADGFDEHFRVLADWDLWIRLATTGRAAACPEVLIGYLEHSTSMLLGDDATVVAEFDRLVEKHRTLTDEYGTQFDRGSFTRSLAVGRVRAGRPRSAAALCLRDAVLRRDIEGVGMAVVSLGGKRALRRLRQMKWDSTEAVEWLATDR